MSGGEEGGGVGDDDVAVGAIEDGGMAGGDLVQVGARGQSFYGPEGMVPAGAEDPGAGFCGGGVDADALEHVGERRGGVEIDGEFLLAGAGHVGVGVVEAGHDEGSGEVDDLGVGALQLEDVGVVADSGDRGVGDRERGDAGRRERGVGCGEVRAGEDAGVDEEGIGGVVLRAQEREAGVEEG